MRLWDLRTPVCQGLLQAASQPTAAFDEQARRCPARLNWLAGCSSSPQTTICFRVQLNLYHQRQTLTWPSMQSAVEVLECRILRAAQ